jgi:hypothetical protein
MNAELRMGEQTRGEHLDFDVGRKNVAALDAEREAGAGSPGSAQKTRALKKNKAKRQARKQQRGR